ncbi:hypothetical protein D0Z07_4089 [Hyphodiscus hymeniophilus]|uniref:Uncharacterized protein n=1 Tax=Hyphodiscus hymeniophilus TaxID=353542 RepID=A0A9P7AY08_9HELO|nr:hypothetical protein D0Z07_4089 [Hyphodiscus hymeniophilus]
MSKTKGQALHSTAKKQKDRVSQRSSLGIVLLPTPEPSPCVDKLPSFAACILSPPGSVDYDSNSTSETLEPISDVALYHHYMQHTSLNLTLWHRDQDALRLELPRLALENRTIFHSMLAVSAACMCCDMIEKEPRTSTNAVKQVLVAGKRTDERVIIKAGDTKTGSPSSQCGIDGAVLDCKPANQSLDLEKK